MPRLTFPQAAVLATFLGLFAAAARVQTENDIWWHLRTGQYICQTASVPLVDHFSHTFAGRPRTPYEWAAEVILYGSWCAAGDFGLMLFTAALATAGCAVVFATSRGPVWLRLAVTVACALAAAVFWTARPQMFSFVGTAAVVALWRSGQRPWLLVPLFLAWAQLHAGWALGFVVLAAALLDLPWRRWLPWVLASGAVLALNPAGWRLWLVPFETVGLSALKQIQEWNPPGLLPAAFPFYALFLATTTAVALNWRRRTWGELLLLALASGLALTAARNISFYAVIAAPLLADCIAEQLGYSPLSRLGGRGAGGEGGFCLQGNPLAPRVVLVLEDRKPLAERVDYPEDPSPPSPLPPSRERGEQPLAFNFILVALVAALAGVRLGLATNAEEIRQIKSEKLPVGAAEYLNQAKPPGPLLNGYNWGGYLMWAAPDYPVFIDGRTDLYRDFVTPAVAAWNAEGDWPALIAGTKLAVLEREAPLAAHLRATGWRVYYDDAHALVLGRD